MLGNEPPPLPFIPIALRRLLCYRNGMSSTARILEVFASIQGEGIYLGQPHLFVRFWNCNLACRYCDSDYRGPYQEMTMEELLSRVRFHLETEGPFQAVSLTGGEPLLWWEFLKGWLPHLKALNQRTYLETNGTLVRPLEEVLPWIDTVAMDLKPPTATGDRSCWESHEAFLKLAIQAGRDLFVKIVVTRDTSEAELEKSFRLVAGIDPGIPVVLQPVTPWGPVREGPEEEQLIRWRRQAERILSEVQVIPQVHHLIGIP